MGGGMKYLLAAVILASAALLTGPASAHVVQATTSLPLSDVDMQDKPKLERALKSAVDQVLTDVIAFKPTLVTLTDAQVVGQRLYVRLLIADEDGERTIQELNRGQQRNDPPDQERGDGPAGASGMPTRM
jgi:hypothetical protein